MFQVNSSESGLRDGIREMCLPASGEAAANIGGKPLRHGQPGTGSTQRGTLEQGAEDRSGEAGNR